MTSSWRHFGFYDPHTGAAQQTLTSIASSFVFAHSVVLKDESALKYTLRKVCFTYYIAGLIINFDGKSKKPTFCVNSRLINISLVDLPVVLVSGLNIVKESTNFSLHLLAYAEMRQIR